MTPVLVALVCAVAAGVGGLAVPGLVRRLPEPPPKPPGDGVDDRERGEDDEGLPAEDPKVPYAEIGARPGLGWRATMISALVGALVGAVVGPDWWLVVLVPLVPVCVALSVVDWHTQLLPTRIVLPATAYAVLAAVAGWAVTQQTDELVRALLGLVVARSLFWVLWLVHSAGMGFGDVRLAALLGVALGHLGWAELLVGVYAGFLVFGVPGLVLAMVRRDRSLLRTAFPFGPFMVVGALLGVLAGPWVARYLGVG